MTDLAFDGKSVAHLDGKVVFLNGGLPGEVVEAEIVSSKPRYDRGVVRRIIRKSDERIEAICHHFEHCGGCTWQDLDYQTQLRFKKKQVIDCLQRLGGLTEVEVREVIGSQKQFFYRNKMEFSFQSIPDGSFRLGLHRRGRWDDIFDLDECHLQSAVSNRLVNCIRNFVSEESIPAYDVRLHTGFMRFLVIREAVRTGQVMVNIVTNYGELPAVDGLLEQLRTSFPEVTTIIHSQNGQKSNIAVAEKETILWGSPFIEEQLFDFRFRIRSGSFFQTNSLQAEVLYRCAFEMLEAKATDRILDLYCGTGTIGILLSPSIAEVIGVELVGDAVISARENARINGVENISFHEGNVKDFLRTNPAAQTEFDAVIVDPPRAGLNPRVLKQLVTMKPTRLLYISCNPATFARDAKALVAKGYHLPAVQPIDMFPHTMHIELVGLFCTE